MTDNLNLSEPRIGRLSAGMPDCASARAASAHVTRERRGGLGLEIVAKLATVLEVEPVELLNVRTAGSQGSN